MDREKVIERIHEAIDMGVCVDLFMDVLELIENQKRMYLALEHDWKELRNQITLMEHEVT